MKHDLKTTLILLLLFFSAQLIGLYITSQYITVNERGDVKFSELPLGIERPQMSPQSSLIYIVFGVLVGTLLLFVLIKLKAFLLWKFWYAFALILSLTISFKAFFSQYISLGLASLLTFFRIKRPSIIVNHLSELFIYGGIAAIFVDLFNFWTSFALLVIISVYDMIAVWKSKHMITLAKFQTRSKLFAGFSLNPGKENILDRNVNVKTNIKNTKKVAKRSAILGGGDVAFPLLFTGTFMKVLIQGGMLKSTAFMYSIIIVLTTTLSLFLLFYFAKEKKFYPAMPFLSLGCFSGSLIVYLII